MRFNILGPLEIHDDDGAVALRGVKPRSVLAVLLLHANEAVSAERLALALWGEDAPGGATKTVQVHVSRLRKALGDAEMITTTPAGYVLRVRHGELDAARFERLVEDGRRALAGGQAEHAAALLREGLTLWRGPALAELAFEPFAQAEVARLEEQRFTALETRIEADLAAGRHADIVAELGQLVATNPTREVLAAHQMLALYRCGRQADALEAYQAARRVLVAEIGVEPGPQLRTLHEAVLRQDVALESGDRTSELPPELDAAAAPPLVGRVDELAWLRLRWSRAREGSGELVVIAGERGSGKSRLAAALAADAHRSGDAVLHASGRGSADASIGILRGLARTSRPTLLVLDDADAARPDVLTQLDASSEQLAGLALLVLVCCDDVDALGSLRSDGVLTLERLSKEAVGEIGGHYASAKTSSEVPAEWLLDASGGLPRRVHEVASQWARREAARHVSAVAGRAATDRAQLRTIQDELAGGVVELQQARERIAVSERGDGPVVCPFKGLASYEVDDARFFFGRERLVAELVARLVGAPLLAVVGPSGSGKSSAMRAGLLPALAGGVLPGSDDWGQALIRPGAHPLQDLAVALAGVEGYSRVVLAVDQFEETFTVCSDEAERSDFVSELVHAAHDPGGRYIVVLALRADQYGRCAEYPELSALLAANNVLVQSMQRDELRRAVEGPCRRAGLRIEHELVEALVADVEREPGGLPLLSTALLELWQRRDGRRLGHRAYIRSGGVRGAVARLAEDAFAQLDAGQQDVARGVLMRLVGAADGDAVERRRIALDDLDIDRDENVARIVALLTDRRLLTVSAGCVELAHEALLREWPRLRGWIEQDREGLRIQRGLTDAAEEWEQLGRDDGALYRGTRLSGAVEWRAGGAAQLNVLERAFLEASEAAHAHERVTRRRRVALVLAALTTGLLAAVVAAIFATQQRDIAQSRDLATKSASLIATDPGLALAIAREALDRSDTEQAQTALRQATLEHRATRVVTAHDGVVFALATSRDGRLAATSGDDRTARIWQTGSGRRIREIRGFLGDVRAVGFSRDGKHIAAAADDGEISVVGVADGARDIVTRLKGDVASSIDFSADGRTLAIGTFGGRVALMRIREGTLRDLGAGHPGGVFAVHFDRSGKAVVSTGADDAARIWPITGGAPVEFRHGGGDPLVLSGSVSPDGALLATTDFRGVLRLWDAAGGPLVRRIKVGDKPLASVRFSSNGRHLVTGGFDGLIHLYDVAKRSLLAEFSAHRGPARADFGASGNTLVSVGEEDGTLRTSTAPATRVAARSGNAPLFARDSPLVVSGDPRGPVHLWNTETGEERTLTAHAEESFAQFSPDGTQVVTASQDGSVLLWDVATGRHRVVPTQTGAKLAAAIDAAGTRIAVGGTSSLVVQALDGRERRSLRGHSGRINTLVFSPDGKHLLTASDDGTARIWNARSGARERVLRGHDGVVRSVSYSSDGRQLATTGSDGTIRVWPAEVGEPLVLVGHEGAVNTAEFDQNGDRVVSAGDDGTVRIWDAESGAPLVVLRRDDDRATGADFSADGGTVVSAASGSMQSTPCEACGSFEAARRVAGTRARHQLTDAERSLLLPG